MTARVLRFASTPKIRQLRAIIIDLETARTDAMADADMDLEDVAAITAQVAAARARLRQLRGERRR